MGITANSFSGLTTQYFQTFQNGDGTNNLYTRGAV